MATILGRIGRSLAAGNEKIPGHMIENALTLYFHGHVTRTQMLSLFGIPPELEADFDQFKTKYDRFPATAQGMADQISWLQDLTACVIGLQFEERNAGSGLTRNNFNTILDLTLDESDGT